jgi:hypothetical protein
MNTLTSEDLSLNAQAATAAAAATGDSITAAARCELITNDDTLAAAGVGGMSRGMMKGMRAMNKVAMPRFSSDMSNLQDGGLPKIFVLAVSSTRVYALEDKHDGARLVLGKVIKEWEREGFLAKSGSMSGAIIAATSGLPDDRQVLTIYVPLEGGKTKYMQAAERQTAAVSAAVGVSTGMPRKLALAKDEASDALIAAIAQQGPPRVMVGDQLIGQPGSGADPASQLTQLAALRDRGLLSSEEFESQKARILSAS